MDNNVNIQSGTVSFWASNAVLTNGDTNLLNITPEGGSISVYIESRNIKVAFVVDGTGRSDLSYSAELLSDQSKHMLTFTWNLPTVIILYIDGVEVSRSDVSDLHS